MVIHLLKLIYGNHESVLKVKAALSNLGIAQISRGLVTSVPWNVHVVVFTELKLFVASVLNPSLLHLAL